MTTSPANARIMPVFLPVGPLLKRTTNNMKKSQDKRRLLGLVCGILAVGGMLSTANASTNFFDFNTDPSSYLNVTRGGDNGELAAMAGAWFPSGGSPLEQGVGNQSTNGYLAITQTTSDPIFTAHGMSSVIIFDDFDPGLIVAGFTFACDVRIGGGSTTPADGFSLNFARNEDPVLGGGPFGSGPDNNPANAREEGTTTGLVVSFDAFANSGADPIGLTIKVDNVVVTNFPMPSLNGACTDPTSLQTGPNTAGITNLCWQPLFVKLGTDGRLSVRYKNVTLLTNFPTTYVPSPGRLVFAGRTGGSWQEQDVDNIRIETIASSSPIVSQTAGNPSGFNFSILDNNFATPDTNTLTVTLDGASVVPSVVFQTNNTSAGNLVTIVGYRNTGLLLLPGSTHTNIVSFSGPTFSGTVVATNVFTIPNYTFLTPAQQAPGTVNTAVSGFAGRIHQLPVARTPNATDLIGIERQLANGFINPQTGQPYVSTALTNTFPTTVINWAQDQPLGGTAGFFNANAEPPLNVPDDPIPGTNPSLGDPDNLAAELVGILDLPVGAYQLGVNHDDGFKLTVGAEPRDPFTATVLSSSTAAVDTSPINIAVTNAGRYPFRLVWGENTGGAHLEFYLIDLTTGQKVLINDRSRPNSINSYGDLGALNRPFVKWVSPAAGETGADPGRPIIAKLQDSGTQTITTATLTANGAGVSTSSKVGGETTVTLTGGNRAGGMVTATLVYSTSQGGTFTNTWTFAQSFYGQVLFDFPLNEGTGQTITDTSGLFSGAFTQGTAIWTNGASGKPGDYALFFDGSRRVTLVDSNRLINLGLDTSGTNGDYTLETWVNLPVGFEPTTRMVMFTYEGRPGFSFSINNTGRTLHTTTFTLNDVNSGAVVPNDGQWHHVAAVHENGERVLFYIDGVLVSAVPYTRGIGARTTYALVLGGANGTANPLVGSLDNLRLTKGALTPAQFNLPFVPAPDSGIGDITSGLVMHLRLDETNSLTAADSTGRGHTGALVNYPDPVSPWVHGVFLNALSFNGADNRVIVDDPAGELNMTNGVFSLAAWIKAPFGQPASGAGVITRGTGGGGEQFNLDILTATGTGGNGGALRFFVRDAGGATTNLQTLGNNTNTINDEWLHVVAVCDTLSPAGGMRLYLNGVLALQGNAPTSLLNTNHEVSLGSRKSSATSDYDLPMFGILDDVRIYKRALNARDARTLYQESTALRLTITGTGSTRTLSWPAWMGNYRLQSATALQPTGTAWSNVAGTPTLSGYYNSQTITISPNENRFYRLIAAP